MKTSVSITCRGCHVTTTDSPTVFRVNLLHLKSTGCRSVILTGTVLGSPVSGEYDIDAALMLV
ncbi:MAG: hypothetical protein ABFD92_21515 [Planctomycetaceae bacterium]